MIVENGNYYLYRHIRLDTNQPFYIGIGEKSFHFNKYKYYSRAYSKLNRNKHWNNIVAKTPYKVEILLESDDREFIEQKEIEFIALYGRNIDGGILTNIETGGGKNLTKNIISYTVYNLDKEIIYKNIQEKTLCKNLNITRGKLLQIVKEKIIFNYNYYILRDDDKITKIENFRLPKGRKKIVQLDLEGNFIKEWESISELCKTLNINSRVVSYCCEEKNIKSYKEFIFLWLNNYNPNKIYKRIDKKATPIKVENIITGQIEIFKTMSEAAKILNTSATLLRYKIDKHTIFKEKYKIFEI